MTIPSETGGSRMLGQLTAEGGDWPEARSFLRTYSHNPHAQAALVKALAGIWSTTRESLEPNTELGAQGLTCDESHSAIEGTIRYMRERFPQWASTERFTLDSDCNLPDYPGCDPYLKHYVEVEILNGNFDRGGVE